MLVKNSQLRRILLRSLTRIGFLGPFRNRNWRHILEERQKEELKIKNQREKKWGSDHYKK